MAPSASIDLVGSTNGVEAGSQEGILEAEVKVTALTKENADLHTQVQQLTERVAAAASKLNEAQALAAMYQKEVEVAQRRAEEAWEKGFDRGFQKGRES